MKRKYSVLLLAAVWGLLTLAAWFLPAQAFSESERRPLAQAPQIQVADLLNGSFMKDFEGYTLDQFPLRDGFRRVKSLFHYYLLGQKDNNGIYLSQCSAAQQEYPLDGASLEHAQNRLQYLYDKYLEPAGSQVWMAIVPDKGYYLAEDAGQLAMDYGALFSSFQQGLPWAEQVDLTGYLTREDYYRTDTHWRQERLLAAAGALCQAMEIPMPQKEDYTLKTLEKPFYGVYYGQAALPMEPDTLYWLESQVTENCTVYDHETGKTGTIYDLEKGMGKDPYELFLSGSKSLLTIHNPQGEKGKELIVFRDSFGSAMVPLLVQGYEQVTLVDIRYIQIDVLERFLEFTGQDVLLLYSTLVLNNSETIK